MLGLSPADYGHAPLRTIINGLRGVQDQQYEEHKDRWESSRFITVNLLNAWTDKEIKPTQLIKFPWEGGEKQIKKPITYNKMVNMLSKIAK